MRIFDKLVEIYIGLPNHVGKLRILDVLLRWHKGDVLRNTQFGKFELSFDDYIQRHMILFGSYEPITLEFILNELKPDMKFLDVGANIGQFSIAVANRQAPQGLTIAVEANPQTATRLLRNRSLNKLQNQMLVACCALGSNDKIQSMHVPFADNIGSSRQSSVQDEASFVVGGCSLTALLEEISLEFVDVIKIDIEGGEAAVLVPFIRDRERQSCPSLIVMEFDEESFSYSFDGFELYDILVSRGYILTDVFGNSWTRGQHLVEHNLVARLSYESQ